MTPQRRFVECPFMFTSTEMRIYTWIYRNIFVWGERGECHIYCNIVSLHGDQLLCICTYFSLLFCSLPAGHMTTYTVILTLGFCRQKHTLQISINLNVTHILITLKQSNSGRNHEHSPVMTSCQSLKFNQVKLQSLWWVQRFVDTPERPLNQLHWLHMTEGNCVHFLTPVLSKWMSEIQNFDYFWSLVFEIKIGVLIFCNEPYIHQWLLFWSV